jgi:hypothetical protein
VTDGARCLPGVGGCWCTGHFAPAPRRCTGHLQTCTCATGTMRRESTCRDLLPTRVSRAKKGRPLRLERVCARSGTIRLARFARESNGGGAGICTYSASVSKLARTRAFPVKVLMGTSFDVFIDSLGLHSSARNPPHSWRHCGGAGSTFPPPGREPLRFTAPRRSVKFVEGGV